MRSFGAFGRVEDDVMSLQVTAQSLGHCRHHRTPCGQSRQAGVEVNVIRSWLGHVSISTTNRYIEIDMAMKRKALETCEVGASGVPPEANWQSDMGILAWLESL